MLETISKKTPAKGVEAMPEWNEKDVVNRAPRRRLNLGIGVNERDT